MYLPNISLNIDTQNCPILYNTCKCSWIEEWSSNQKFYTNALLTPNLLSGYVITLATFMKIFSLKVFRWSRPYF